MPAVDHRRVSERGRRHWYALPKYILWEWCMLVMPEAPLFTSSAHGWMAMLLLSESLKMYCTVYFSIGVLCLHGRCGLVEWARILKPLRFVIRASWYSWTEVYARFCEERDGQTLLMWKTLLTPSFTFAEVSMKKLMLSSLASSRACNVRLDIDQDIGRGSSMPGASGYTY